MHNIGNTFPIVFGQTGFFNSRTIANQYISNTEFKDYIEGYNDTLRILRLPIVTIDKDNLVVIHDMYTNITGESLTYYRTPNYFTPL